eukprot:jgi/Mesvir1/17742/Mv05598-RA.1
MIVTIAMGTSTLDGRGIIPTLVHGGHFLLYGAQDWSKQTTVDNDRQQVAMSVATGAVPAPPIRSIAVVLSLYDEASFQDMFQTLRSALQSMRQYASSLMYPATSHLVVVMDGSNQDHSSQIRSLTGRGDSDPEATKAYLARSYRRRLDEAMDLVYRLEDDPPGLLSRLDIHVPEAVVLDHPVGCAATRNVGAAVAASLGADTFLFLDAYDTFLPNYIQDTLLMLVGLGTNHCSVRGWAATEGLPMNEQGPNSATSRMLTTRLPSTLVIRRWCFDLVGGWQLPPATQSKKHGRGDKGSDVNASSRTFSEDLYMTAVLAALANATGAVIPLASVTPQPALVGIPAGGGYSRFAALRAPPVPTRGVMHQASKKRPALLAAAKDVPLWLQAADLAATQAAMARAQELVVQMRRHKAPRA